MSDSEDSSDMLGRFTAVNSNQPKRQKLPPVQVVVPPVENPEDFEFLPGHSQVEEILQRTKGSEPASYSVLLRSGDVETISSERLSTLRHGSSALREFQSRNSDRSMRLRRGRRNVGFVQSTSLVFSDDDNDQPSKSSGRRLRVRKTTSLDESGSEDSYTRPTRRSARLVLSRAQTRDTSDDESSASSNDELGDSSIIRRPLGRRRGRKPKDGNVIIAPAVRRGVRHSQRVSSTKSMAERLEDDISEVEGSSAGTKYSSAKEFFISLPKDDPFRLRHRQICDTCSTQGDNDVKGPLVFCSGCTHSYHRQCLGSRSQRDHLVTKVGEKTFVLQCRRCIGVATEKDANAPHQGSCSQCNELGALAKPLRPKVTARKEQLQREENGGTDPITLVDKKLLNNVDNIMFRCVTCSRAFHMSHLPPRSKAGSSRMAIDSDDQSQDEESVADKRFKEYSRRWTCEQCAHIPGEIEELVAWRPVDIEDYTPGYTVDMIKENAREYLIKWRKHSYFKTTWMPGPWVWGVTTGVMRKAFFQTNSKPKMTAEDAIPEEYLLVDIIFDLRYSNVVTNSTFDIDMARAKEVEKIYVKYKGLAYENAVWETIPSPKETERWQSYQEAYNDWVLGKYTHLPKPGNLKKHLSHVRSQDFSTKWVKQSQPALLTGGKIMEYQKDGLNWLYYMWFRQQNAILADEMGLGKTIQVIALFATLVEDHKCWPFLVVVPNSTCPNWRREIKTWAPSLRAVTYYGSSAARKIAHDYEMLPEGGSDLRCHIVITSYETMIDDKAKRIFSHIPWTGLIVDEGQRLKNDKNLLYQSLSKINFPFKVLLTGTPLQNNTRELFNLLQFLDPSKDAETLEQQYTDLTSESVQELHDMIRPFFLRRTKAQVLNFLPPVAQIIVPVTMSIVQKKLYKSILAKNPQLIKAIFNNSPGHTLKQTERHNLNNILMQLRKCLCHPFVYSSSIEERGVSATVSHRNLVEASAKLQLLEVLLMKLHERGHRVLIFSQFIHNLDVTEDFLDGLGLMHRRLDGSMSSLQKQKQIDEFNAPNSPYFAFLLSTRSGGVGINLATADTVIIMDPDFNPHQDIQAMSRAHRIGQQRKVLVFQLMMKDSVEEKIMQIGRKKMALNHVLIDCMGADVNENIDVEAMLRHGADALFDEKAEDEIRYDDLSIEKLLDRSQMENTKVGDDASAESQFSFARVWVNDSAALEDNLASSENATPSTTVWDKILKERERQAEEEARAKAETLGRGKRKRQTVDYAFQQDQLQSSQNKPQGESDTEFQAAAGESEAEDGETDDDFTNTPRKSVSAQARPYKRAKVPTPDTLQEEATMLTAAGQPEPQSHQCMACDQFHQPGYCRLKLAGVEHCGLCGIAHFGYSRTCPHLNSETQVAVMLGSLKESTEQRALVDEATKYLRGVRGDLVQRKKRQQTQAEKTQPPSTSHYWPPHNAHGHPPPMPYAPPGSAPLPPFPPPHQYPATVNGQRGYWVLQEQR